MPRFRRSRSRVTGTHCWRGAPDRPRAPTAGAAGRKRTRGPRLRAGHRACRSSATTSTPNARWSLRGLAGRRACGPRARSGRSRRARHSGAARRSRRRRRWRPAQPGAHGARAGRRPEAAGAQRLAVGGDGEAGLEVVAAALVAAVGLAGDGGRSRGARTAPLGPAGATSTSSAAAAAAGLGRSSRSRAPWSRPRQRPTIPIACVRYSSAKSSNS